MLSGRVWLVGRAAKSGAWLRSLLVTERVRERARSYSSALVFLGSERGWSAVRVGRWRRRRWVGEGTFVSCLSCRAGRGAGVGRAFHGVAGAGRGARLAGVVGVPGGRVAA